MANPVLAVGVPYAALNVQEPATNPAPVPVTENARRSPISKARAVAAIVLSLGAIGCNIALSKFHLSRGAFFGATMGSLGGFLGAFSVALPSTIRSKCHAISVVSRRTIGTLTAMAGAFVVDAARQATNNSPNASYYGALTLLVGGAIAFGPEIWERCRDLPHCNGEVEQR